MRKERMNEIWGVLFLLLGLFTLTSLIFFDAYDMSFYTSQANQPMHNCTGVTGAWLAFGLLLTFGVSAYLIPMLFLLWSGCFFLQRVPEKKMFKFAGLAIALFSTATMVAISVSPEARFAKAGVIGYLTGSHLLTYFGMLGSYIVAGSCLLLSLLLATDFLLYPIFKNFWKQCRGVTGGFGEIIATIQVWVDDFIVSQKPEPDTPERKTRKQRVEEKKKKIFEPKLPNIQLKVKKYQPNALPQDEPKAKDTANQQKALKPEAPAPRKRADEKTPAADPNIREEAAAAAAGMRPAASESTTEEDGHHVGVIGSKKYDEGEYAFPPIDLLKRSQPGEQKSDDLQGNSKILEETLADFGIEVKVVEVEQGPVITRYELLPAPGVKINSITALADDIALAMKAASVRMIAPIPGKSAVGVEVPNAVTTLVQIRELVESREFRAQKHTLPLALGKDTSGRTLIADLADMPHILIAGTTGSGKTVCVNSIIMGLVYHATPADLKFVMIDPKMVELAVYNKLPHMLAPVVTNVKKAAHTLNWVVSEMENRFKLLATVGVRNITAFNERPISEEDRQQLEGKNSENVVPAKMPHIIVIIDELADLMMIAQDKVEGAITRLAQLSRAVGIHLILATQRPSVDVITGVIKANFPARVSFKVASKIDSRTVLDANGADKLLGKGDMLFMQPGDEKPTRGQAALTVDPEINAVVKFLSGQGKPDFHPEILQAQEGKSVGGGALEKDELFDEAVAIVLETGQASTSNLQRRMRLGYTRAARIIDQMEAEGLVGPSQGAKPRDIYIGRESEEIVEAE